ncbi:AMP-binding protein, partial [Pseudonocardia abyssalis]
MTDSFNAATFLTEDRVTAGDADRVAIHHPGGSLTYLQLTEEVRRVAAGLVAIGVRPEERVLLAMVDDVELATGILAAMYVGAVAVPSSTMLTGPELAKLVVDSRARVLLGSSEFTASVTIAATGAPDLRHLVLTGDTAPEVPGVTTLTWDELRTAEPLDAPYPTWEESPALWLYTSGTTGTPKGAMHRHADIRFVCDTYAREVLRIGPDDVCLSGAKLFFAY